MEKQLKPKSERENFLARLFRQKRREGGTPTKPSTEQNFHTNFQQGRGDSSKVKQH